MSANFMAKSLREKVLELNLNFCGFSFNQAFEQVFFVFVLKIKALSLGFVLK